MRASDFDYPLDPGRIAQKPVDRRDASRLMRLSRPRGETADHRFAELPDLLREGDVLVVNDTRVIPARFFARRPTGGRIEGLFLREEAPGVWQVLLKGAGRCKLGEKLALEPDAPERLTLVERGQGGEWRVEIHPAAPAVDVLERVGQTPLPPYIHRGSAADDAGDGPGAESGRADRSDAGDDRSRYQTIYASRPGAVAAPTAGLHFTPEVLKGLEARGIDRVQVTLHVGLGTFAPVKAEQLHRHPMHREWYEMSWETAERLNRARQQGRRVVAVGTTSVRVLETVRRQHETFRPTSGWTEIFLYPPADFPGTDALITNFHLPRSTLMMLVAAFCQPGGTGGVEVIRQAYLQAAERGYRFYSYGDAMLIE